MGIRQPYRLLITIAALLCAALITTHGAVAKPTKAEPKKDDYISIVDRPSAHLLYRLEHKHSPTAYVFGTFHSDSPKLAPLLAHAGNALSLTQLLLVEIAVTNDTTRKAMQYLTYPAEHPGLKSVLSPTLYETAVAVATATLKIPADQINRYKPWALAIIMQYPPAEADGQVMDEKLQRMAAAKNMGIKGLESIESQLRIFDGMRPKDQIGLLEFNLAEADGAAEQMKTLAAHYLKQDVHAIAAMGDGVFAELAKQYPQIASHLKEELIIKRNLRMVGRAIPFMRKQPVFMAVGALHLPGKDGVLALFEKRGYRIYPVEPKEVAMPTVTAIPESTPTPDGAEPLSELLKATEPQKKPVLPADQPSAIPEAKKAPDVTTPEALPAADTHSTGAAPAPAR